MDARTTTETLRQHGHFVHQLARALLRDPAAAEDVAQETWVQWWRRAEAPANPRGWLARVVRSLASNQRRASERRAHHEADHARPEGSRTPDEDLEEAELLHRVVDAVYALEEPYRETILARYFRGEEAPALARASGTPLATVRSRERRALEMLRARLDRVSGGRAAWAFALSRLVPLEPAAGAGALLLPWIAAAFLGAAGALGWRQLRQEDPAATAVAHELAAPSVAAVAPDPGLAAASVPGERAALTPSPAPGSGTYVDAAAGRPEPSTLVGTTQDPEGRALAGVRLRFTRANQAVGSGSSDGSGRFELAGMASFDQVEAELEGYRFLCATDPEPDPLHPFEPMRVTLAPAGEIVVNVHDVTGETLENVAVCVYPRAEEHADTSGNEPSLGWRHAPIEATTDGAGRAVLTNVWSGVRLVLELDLEAGADTGEVLVERQRDGRLVLDGGGGTPIVLAGRALELTAQWGALHTLEGIVLDAQGAPVSHAYLEVFDEGYSMLDPDHRLAQTRSRDRGRFEAAFRPPALRGPVHVRATVAGAPHHVGRDDSGGPGALLQVPELLAERSLTPEELAAPEPLVLTLALSREACLTGILLDARGDPSDGRANQLLLLRGGVAVPILDSVYCRTSGGGFAFFGQTPGSCDLLVASRDPLERSQTLGEPAFARFAGLDSGSEGLALVLPDTAPVRIRIRGEALQSFSLARLLPAQPGTFSRRPAERTLVLREPAFWLPGDNGERLERPEGTWLVAESKTRGAREVELVLGEPGWYRIGATSALPLAIVSSELLWFDAGEYVLDVQPPPATGILCGRLVADGTREFYGLVLANEHGLPFPIAAPTSGERLDVHPIKASGEFLLRDFPVGRYRLRFGSTDELVAGRWAREVALEIHPGENALEVRL